VKSSSTSPFEIEDRDGKAKMNSFIVIDMKRGILVTTFTKEEEL
jgi:hypothetical protein